jgi:hypothetical protein
MPGTVGLGFEVPARSAIHGGLVHPDVVDQLEHVRNCVRSATSRAARCSTARWPGATAAHSISVGPIPWSDADGDVSRAGTRRRASSSAPSKGITSKRGRRSQSTRRSATGLTSRSRAAALESSLGVDQRHRRDGRRDAAAGRLDLARGPRVGERDGHHRVADVRSLRHWFRREHRERPRPTATRDSCQRRSRPPRARWPTTRQRP